MKILFLGGTQFVGRHMVERAMERGHEVTLFNRGKTNPDLFQEAEKLIGDRDGGLERLRDRRWDAVIDVNGYLPRLVKDSAQLLADSVAHYVFVSTPCPSSPATATPIKMKLRHWRPWMTQPMKRSQKIPMAD